MKPDKKKTIEDFFDLHYAGLCCYANSIVDNNAIAEDIASDVFIDFWLKYSKEPDRIKNIKAYLFTSARNQCLLYLKKQDRQVAANNEYYHLAGLTDDEMMETQMLIAKCVERILTCIETLPPGYRNVFKLYYQEDLPINEIASLLQVNIGTIKSQKYKAETKLRKMVLEESLFP